MMHMHHVAASNAGIRCAEEWSALSRGDIRLFAQTLVGKSATETVACRSDAPRIKENLTAHHFGGFPRMREPLCDRTAQ